RVGEDGEVATADERGRGLLARHRGDGPLVGELGTTLVGEDPAVPGTADERADRTVDEAALQGPGRQIGGREPVGEERLVVAQRLDHLRAVQAELAVADELRAVGPGER